MPTAKNKSHIQGILKKNGKNTTLHNFVLFFLEKSFQKRLRVFHQISKRSKTIKPLGLSSDDGSFREPTNQIARKTIEVLFLRGSRAY